MSRVRLALVSSLEGNMVECGKCFKKWFDTYMRLDNGRGSVSPLCLDCFERLFVYDAVTNKYVFKDCKNCSLRGNEEKCKNLNNFAGTWLAFDFGSRHYLSCDWWDGGERYEPSKVKV